MRRTFVLLTSASLLPACGAAAAPAPKKPVAKPAVRKPAATPKAGGPVVLGTKQLPGDFGRFGTAYTIGRHSPINFTLKSAEYRLSRVSIDTTTWVPKASEKVLVLRYTIQNPTPRDLSYYWGDLTFTAVDTHDANHRFVQAVAREGGTERVQTQLKPAQKMDVWTAILVPAEGVVPKLIVEREAGAPVIRYDLRGKVKPLTSPYCDTADTAGATAPKQVLVPSGETVSLGVFDGKLDSVAYTKEPIEQKTLDAGQRFLTATFTLKNMTTTPQNYYWGDFVAEVRDADGEKAPYVQSLFKASRNERAQGTLQPGEEYRVRFYFVLPENVEGKMLLLKESKLMQYHEARVFGFDLSGAK